MSTEVSPCRRIHYLKTQLQRHRNQHGPTAVLRRQQDIPTTSFYPIDWWSHGYANYNSSYSITSCTLHQKTHHASHTPSNHILTCFETGGSVLQSPLIMPMLLMPQVPAKYAGQQTAYLLHNRSVKPIQRLRKCVRTYST